MALNYSVKAPGVQRIAVTATITNGTSVSNSIDLSYTSIIGFSLPSAWTAAGVTLEFSNDNTNWLAGVFDSTATAVGVWSSGAASTGYSVDLQSCLPWRYVRIRSGTTATPVNQGADRAITVILRPLA